MVLFLLLILCPIFNLAESLNTSPSTYHPKEHKLINFGLQKSSNDGGPWLSDEDFVDASPLTSTAAMPVDAIAPYNVARVFRTPTNYSVPVSTSGPIFIRLFLYPPSSTSYNNIDIRQSFLSLTVNGVEILRNFSGYIAANTTAHPKIVSQGLVREVYFTVDENNKALNFTFSPQSKQVSFGFINGVEIISVPDELYINRSSTTTIIPYLMGNPLDYYVNQNYSFDKSLAMENIIRLNNGGRDVNPEEDTGICRTWYSDSDFVTDFGANPSRAAYNSSLDNITYTATPAYTAPALVYGTTSSPPELMPNKNVTWKLEVDNGFDYLVRLHFCDIYDQNNQVAQLVFDIHINQQLAFQSFDVYGTAGGQYIPTYKDVVTLINSTNTSSESSRVLLWVSVVAQDHRPLGYYNAFLNGLEVFKLSSKGSLAAPNPAYMGMLPSPTNSPQKKSNSHRLLAILGGILGGILVLLGILACFRIIYLRNKANKQKFMDATSMQDSSKLKWWFAMDDSASTATSASMVSSLPSELCRHFSLAQIKIATGNFDKKLIVGKGGFGEVYKGSITDPVNGTIQVAIKRLNTKSKQGAREFQTEIEMLSRLRHLHLVSLIGYCEDEGEMILVYEYMSRGTLRDHLMYKKSDKNDPSKTPLSWKQRLMICVGSARGLHYLHTGARRLIIHRDVKSTNILLDENWTAKVSDFGLSKAGPISLGLEMGPTHISTAVKGSAGYLDPEYYRCHKLTEKSDVYSFGVVLFEVLCARAAVNPALRREQANLAIWAQNHYKNGTLHTIVDPIISSQISPECLRKFGEIAEMCVRDCRNERPSMGDVVWGLEFALQLQETAERNTNISGDSLEEVMGPSSNSSLNIGDDGGNTDNEKFTFSRSSSNTSVATKKLLESKSTTGYSSDYGVNMNSASVFSEIIDPTAR